MKKMDEFDRDIFECLVEKVIIGSKDSEGNPNPYVITFVLKEGLKFDDESLKNLYSFQSNDVGNPCFYSINTAR